MAHKMILGSFLPSQVLADFASFMDVPDAVTLSLASPKANEIVSSYRALARPFKRFTVAHKMINIYDENGLKRSLPLDERDEELAHKQILSFISTVCSVQIVDTGDCRPRPLLRRAFSKVEWSNIDIDDKIASELQKIDFRNEIFIRSCEIFASTEIFRRFLAKNPKKVVLMGPLRASPTLINDEVLLLLNSEHFEAIPLKKSYQISTFITDDFLMSTNLERSSPRWKKLSLDEFLNIHLTFAAILKFSEEIIGETNLGIIGYQEMDAVLQYYDSKVWSSWKTVLNKIDDYSHVRFDVRVSHYQFASDLKDIFNTNDNTELTFSISLDRNVTGAVENAVIPEKLVDRETVEKFKSIDQDLNSNTLIGSVIPNRIVLKYLSVSLVEHDDHSDVTIEADIVHPANARGETYQPVYYRKTVRDQSSMEDMVVKIMKSCSSIDELTMNAEDENGEACLSLLKMSDRLFCNLLEHAAHTEITKEWSMDLEQLSDANRTRLSENRTVGIFRNLKIEAGNLA